MNIGRILLFSAIFLASCSKESKEPESPVFGTCEAVTPKGRLVKTGDSFTYKTSGGITIKFGFKEIMSITHDDYPAFKLELWGVEDGTGLLAGNHESLNGKHLKDREGLRRTIIFPDGAKITLIGKGVFYDPLVAVSIYDDNGFHHINMSCKTLEYSTASTGLSTQLDDAEADGETATIEVSATGLLFVNIYNEHTPGNKIMNRVPLGELNWSNPNMVNDFYDDPRLSHT